MRSARSRSEPGFTLLELLIVVAIIGILAAVAIPRFAQILEKAREGATKGNLTALKGACKVYYSDWGGKWPQTLDVGADYPFSRYIDVIPGVRCSQPTNTNISPAGEAIFYMFRGETPAWFGTGWAYDSTLGNVYVNSIGADTRGASYSTY